MLNSEAEKQITPKRTMDRRGFLKWGTAVTLGLPMLADMLLTACSEANHSHFIPTPENLAGEVGRIEEVDLHNLKLVNQGIKIRVARNYPITSRQSGRDERDLIVNVYSLNGNSNALIYDVQKQVLMPGQEALNDSWWGMNVVGQMISKDPSLIQASGDTQPMVGQVYSTFAKGETSDNTKEPSGPLVLLALSKGS